MYIRGARSCDSLHFLKLDLDNSTINHYYCYTPLYIKISFQVILVNVVHLRDPVCPLPTSILAQYMKQASGQLSCLKVNGNPNC